MLMLLTVLLCDSVGILERSSYKMLGTFFYIPLTSMAVISSGRRKEKVVNTPLVSVMETLLSTTTYASLMKEDSILIGGVCLQA